MVAAATSEETELQPRNLTIGILGGTGAQGRGLARRLSAAGLAVVIGSREKDRASETAESLGNGVQGATNLEVAEIADVVIVAVPWKGHADLLTEVAPALAHKVVVDCVNPLGFDKEGPYVLAVNEGSAAQQAAVLLPHSRVTAAFHHVSADVLEDPQVASIDMDVMILGEDRGATTLVAELVDLIPGMRGIYAGRLRNAGQVEGLTANLIAVNRRYRVHAGIRITDV